MKQTTSKSLSQLLAQAKKTLLIVALLTSSLIYTSSAYAKETVALIDTVSTKSATGEVAQVYKEINEAWHMVPNPMKLYSTNPEMLKQKWASYQMMGYQLKAGQNKELVTII